MPHMSPYAALLKCSGQDMLIQHITLQIGIVVVLHAIPNDHKDDTLNFCLLNQGFYNNPESQ